MKKFLLVEPDFPIPSKSKNHKNFLPIGLLKIASFLRNNGNQVKLIRGIPKKLEEIEEIQRFKPEEVWVTSLFTYWAKYVKDIVDFYKKTIPYCKIIVGGIYASLFQKEEVKKYTGCDDVYQGILQEVEGCLPAYDLLKNTNPRPIDYQIIHASRGCLRKCAFCGTWKIEPCFLAEKSIRERIIQKKLVFYDNNLLMNPYIENILEELIELKNKRILWCESQSGFDGRILLNKPYLAKMIKQAGFRYPRIAWDWKFKDFENIRKQVDILIKAGYSSKEIFIFVLYNWDVPFHEMEKKRIKCWEWGVQIADCRYRPLNQLYDNYNPRIIGQNNKDYYIHEKSGWTDELIKQYRRNVRRQNICVRHGFPFYSKSFEHKSFGKSILISIRKIKGLTAMLKYMDSLSIDYWIPDKN